MRVSCECGGGVLGEYSGGDLARAARRGVRPCPPRQERCFVRIELPVSHAASWPAGILSRFSNCSALWTMQRTCDCATWIELSHAAPRVIASGRDDARCVLHVRGKYSRAPSPDVPWKLCVRRLWPAFVRFASWFHQGSTVECRASVFSAAILHPARFLTRKPSLVLYINRDTNPGFAVQAQGL